MVHGRCGLETVVGVSSVICEGDCVMQKENDKHLCETIAHETISP